MKGKLTVIGTDFMETNLDLTDTPSLEMLRAAVGGPIEVVPLFTKFGNAPCVAFCHEEGKLEGLLRNILAQEYWEISAGCVISGDWLVGPIAIVTGDDELLASL